MKLIRKLIGLAVVIALAVFAYYHFYGTKSANVLEPIVNKFNQIKDELIPPAPCTRQVQYSIGFFDTRFGISTSTMKADLIKAANIWNTALGKKALAYSDSGTLDVNLIYDYREQATLELQSIGGTIFSYRSTYDSLQTKYNSLLGQYNTGKARLQSELDAYGQNISAYNAQVAYWNTRGGAPTSEYQKLQSQKQSLDAAAASYEQDRVALNKLADNLNSVVTELNMSAKELNTNVKTYNTVGASTGEKFNEGEYIEDASGKRINIYQFNTEDKLVRVLEHEFGHALGLDHVSDPDAVMYYMNEGENGALTASDIGELRKVCGSVTVTSAL
jgi:hypothetical protein